METLPGLDSCRGGEATLKGSFLGPLLEWAKAVVPNSQHSSTPLFLFATAGVRRLPDDVKQQLMSDVKKVLRASGFRLLYNLRQCGFPSYFVWLLI